MATSKVEQPLSVIPDIDLGFAARCNPRIKPAAQGTDTREAKRCKFSRPVCGGP